MGPEGGDLPTRGSEAVETLCTIAPFGLDLAREFSPPRGRLSRTGTMRHALPVVAICALLLAGCVANHHHHPPGYDETDEVFDRYFDERTGADGDGNVAPGPNQP